MVTRFLPPVKRAEVEVIYASVRYPDEIADSFALPAAHKLELLEEWRSGYEKALGRPGIRESLLTGVPCFLAAFADVVRRRSIPHRHYLDFLEAMRHDVRPGVFQSLPDLLDRYVHGSATVVGYFLAHVYGPSDRTCFSETLASARELGIALQLTNFARDIADDHRRGRLYIPLDVLAAEGLDPDNYFQPANRPKLRRCVRWMAAEAERRYAEAERTLDAFAPDCQAAIRACIDVYRQLNTKVGAGIGDLRTRQTVPTLDKFRVLPPSKYWRLPLAYLKETVPTRFQDQRPLHWKGSRPETVIVGGGLGGLSAAIHLGLAGQKVTVFEANPLTGGRANLLSGGGFRFDTGPSLLNYPWVFEDLFRAAGRDLKDYLDLIRVEPSVEFAWPDGTTLQLSSDTGRLAAQFEALEHGAASGLERFLADAGAKYRLSFEKLVCRNEDNPLLWFGALSPGEMARLSVWRSLYSELRRYFRSRYIMEALGSYGMYLGGSPFDLPGLFSILPYGEIAMGLWLPRGGVYALVQAMEALAREIGVSIHTGQRVSRIIVRENSAVGVELKDGLQQPFTTVVSNVDVPETEAVLLGRRPRKLRMTPAVLTFYWGLRRQPTNLRHHAIFLPEDYRRAFDELFRLGRIPSDLPFYTSAPSHTDPSLAPGGSTAMFVLVPVPLLSRLGHVNWEDLAATVRARVLDRLRRHGVRIGAEDFVFEQVMTPQDWKHRFGLYDGSAFGAAHNLLQVGPLRPRNYSREIAGLYYVGASTTPGTGMPMVVLSGRMLAERIASHAR